MHEFYSFQATLSSIMFAIVSQLIKPSPFTSLWSGSVFCWLLNHIMLGNNQKYSHSNNQNNQSTKAKLPFTTDANTFVKGCITASKLSTESETYLLSKIYFCFYVLFTLCLLSPSLLSSACHLAILVCIPLWITSSVSS